MHTAPLASVWCWYKVGSKDEVTGLTGVSHWVEHMNFKGTTNIPRDQVKGIIEKFGGSWNGYTWIDQTTYMETASTAGLDRMLFIEAERMANCIYDPDDCESERTVIISELQGSENDPDTLLEQEVIAAAYKVHPYRHPTIGWLSDLQTMTRDDLYQYYRRNYVPNNATVVVVGDVDTDDVLRRVEKQFGAIPAGPAPRRVSVVEPEQLGERRIEVVARGHDRVSEAGVSRAGGRRSPISFRCSCSTRFSPARRASTCGRASARRLRSAARACIARSSSAGWLRASAPAFCRPSIPFCI